MFLKLESEAMQAANHTAKTSAAKLKEGGTASPIKIEPLYEFNNVYLLIQ